MKRYHYKLKDGYEEVFPFMPLSLRTLALDFDQADTNLIIAYGVEALTKYQIFTITKI